MFKLVTVEDTIQIPPHLFGYARERAVEHIINRRLSDRVMPEVGLVIALWDIESLSAERLIPTSGEASVLARFRILVFAPFRGEALFARVRASTEAGLLAYLDFFEPLWIPSESLPKPSTFDAKDNVWVWRPTFDGTQMEYFMDVNTDSVVRVNHVRYDKRKQATGKNATDKLPPPVMAVTAVLHDPVANDNQGLGDPAWWFEEEEPADAPGEDYADDAEDGQGEIQEDDTNAGEYDDYAFPHGDGNEEQWQEEAPAGEELIFENGVDDAVGAEGEED